MARAYSMVLMVDGGCWCCLEQLWTCTGSWLLPLCGSANGSGDGDGCLSLPAELCLALPLPSVRHAGHGRGNGICRFAASSCQPAGLHLAWLDSLWAWLNSLGISVTALGCLVLLEQKTSPTCHPGPDGFSCVSEMSLQCHPSQSCVVKLTEEGQKWGEMVVLLWCQGLSARVSEREGSSLHFLSWHFPAEITPTAVM